MSDTQIKSWRELFEKTIELGLGAALLTKESAQRLVDELVKKGDVSREEGKKLVSDMLEKGKGQKEKMETFVSDVAQRMIEKANVAKNSRVDELEQRLAAVEQRLSQIESTAGE